MESKRQTPPPPPGGFESHFGLSAEAILGALLNPTIETPQHPPITGNAFGSTATNYHTIIVSSRSDGQIENQNDNESEINHPAKEERRESCESRIVVETNVDDFSQTLILVPELSPDSSLPASPNFAHEIEKYPNRGCNLQNRRATVGVTVSNSRHRQPMRLSSAPQISEISDPRQDGIVLNPANLIQEIIASEPESIKSTSNVPQHRYIPRQFRIHSAPGGRSHMPHQISRNPPPPVTPTQVEIEMEDLANDDPVGNDSEDDEISSSPPSRIASAKLAVRNRLANLVKVEVTVRVMREDVRRNLFAPSLEFLRWIFNFGYFSLMVPFRITLENGIYSMKTNILQMILCGLMLLSTIFHKIHQTRIALEGINVHAAISVTETTYIVTTLLTSICYFCVALFFTKRFYKFFERFRLPNEPRNGYFKSMVGGLLGVTFCLAYGNWMAWGKGLSKVGVKMGILRIYNTAMSATGLSPDSKGILFQIAFTMSYLTTNVFSHAVPLFIELLLWGAAIATYKIERTKRTYCIQDDVPFDFEQGTTIFRDAFTLVNKDLSKAFGLLIACSAIGTVAHSVLALTLLCFYDWNFHTLIVLVIKLGYFFIAAEASANDENLTQQILLRNINRKAVMRGQQHEEALSHQRRKMKRQLQEFKDVTREPVALAALDFAKVGYGIIGWMTVSVIGYFLVVAEWIKEERKP